jgi:hypothetical protein
MNNPGSASSGKDAPSSLELYPEIKKWKLNPLVLLMLMVFSIFSSEVAVMVFLGFIPGISRYALPIVDAVLLSLLVFPFLYFLIFRPMKLYISECSHYREKIRKISPVPPEQL